METLKELMKKVLADTFTMYLKAHNYHWNVEGPMFPQLHVFFGDLYLELHGAVDPIAEQIRVLDVFAPGSLKRFSEITEIVENDTIPVAIDMVKNLLNDNSTVLKTLNLTLKFAEKEEKQGLVDFLTARVDIHEKHGWMLRSISKV